MARIDIEALRKKNDTFTTSGLSSDAFNTVFNRIAKMQKEKRDYAKRTLRPSVFTNPTKANLRTLGAKSKSGDSYTRQDIAEFQQIREAARQKYDSKTAGVTYAYIVANSREIDIKRANNKVTDGRGITRAALLAVKNNIIHVRVKASSVSKHEEHRVQLRLEEWDNHLQNPPDKNYEKAVKLACSGRMSIDCDCGRHQYWGYRYIATLGNFAITPPSERDYPKKMNKTLTGVACKHVLKASSMLQSPVWHKILATHMKRQADRVGFGDSNRIKFLSATEQKEAAKNRKTQTNQSEAERAVRKYEKDQELFKKALEKAKKEIAKNKRKPPPKRTKPRKTKEDKLKENIQKMSAMIKFGFQSHLDLYKMQGKTKEQAISDYAQGMGVSTSQLKKILK